MKKSAGNGILENMRNGDFKNVIITEKAMDNKLEQLTFEPGYRARCRLGPIAKEQWTESLLRIGWTPEAIADCFTDNGDGTWGLLRK